MILSVPGWFSPKYCVLWHFYGSDVLGRWLFPFTDGGNIYSNWEATYQLVSRFLGKGNKGKCKYKMQKQKQIQVQIYAWWQHHIQFGNNIPACNKKRVWRACLDRFDKLLSLVWFRKKTDDFFLLFPRFWVISAPLQSVLAIAFPLYHAPSTAATIYNIASLCVKTSLFFKRNVLCRESDYLRLFGTLLRQIIHIWQEN